MLFQTIDCATFHNFKILSYVDESVRNNVQGVIAKWLACNTSKIAYMNNVRAGKIKYNNYGQKRI